MRRELVVPCFNEADRFRPEAFRDFLDTRPDWHLRLVDDGSEDPTLARLKVLAASRAERVRVLAMPNNRGKAEAVRLGVLAALAAGAEVIGYWDADLATPLEVVAVLEQALIDNPEVDFVLGSRVQLLGREIRRNARRHYLGRVFATAAAGVLRMPVYDTQCGAKLFRVRPFTSTVFERPFRTRWVFDVELLLRWRRARVAAGLEGEGGFHELPVPTWIDVPGSKVGVRDALRAVWDLGRLEMESRRNGSPGPRGRRGGSNRDS